MIIEAQVKQWGNSYGIRISKEAAQRLGIEEKDAVSVDIVKKGKGGFGIFKGSPGFQRERQDRF